MRACIKKCGIHIYIGQLALLAILSAGWWGILYPNFSLTEDTFQAVWEETEAEKDAGNRGTEKCPALSGTEAFFSMLEAEPGRVKIKSRFVEAVLGIRGKEDE